MVDPAVAGDMEDVEMVLAEGGNQVLQLRDGTALFHNQIDGLLVRGFEDISCLLAKTKKELSILCGHPQHRKQIPHANSEMFVMLIDRCGMVRLGV